MLRYFNYAIESSSGNPDDTASTQNPQEKFLECHIDPDFGLLDKLLGDATLSSKEYYSIREKGTRIRKNRKLLQIAKVKNLYPQLLETLKDDDQSHVTNYLHTLEKPPYDRTFGDNLPLTYKEEKTIDLNRDIITSLLRNSSQLVQELYWKEVINERQKDHICSLVDTKTSEALLDILQRRSIQNYKDAIECLREANQTLVADILDGHVIGRIRCRLENKSNFGIQKSKQIVEDLISVNGLENDRLFGLEFVQCKGKHIVLYFHFASHSELEEVRQKLQSGQLENLLQEVFCKYFAQMEKPKSLAAEWVSYDYRRCSQCFNHIFHPDFRRLLPELLEMILAKTVLMRMYRKNSARSLRDKFIFSNLASVDFLCWNLMKNCNLKNRIRPFSKVYFKRANMRSNIIRNNRDFFKEVIHPDEIIFPLKSCGCLTEDQVTFLTRLGNRKDKNNELLLMLQDFSSRKYSKFIDCLFATTQTPAALVLERGGETAKVHVHNIKATRTKLLETEFIDKFQLLQRENTLILNDLINVPAENTLNDVFILHAKWNKGIELWFWCKTETSLNGLKSLNDEALRDIIQRIYRRLIPEHYASLKPQITERNNIFVSYFAERQLSVRQMGTIAASNVNRNSQCLTSLDDKIYVIRRREILVYDNKYPYEHLKIIKLNPSTMSDTISIASCNINKCLYICDPANACIVKMEPDFDNRMSEWFNEGEDYKISITKKGDVLLFDTSPSLRIISYEGTVKRTIPVDSHFSQTQCIQEITPDLVALSYQIEVPRVPLVSFVAIMCLDENGAILRDFELQRHNVCLASLHHGDLLIGLSGVRISGYSKDLLFRRSTISDDSHRDLFLRNRNWSLKHWLLESKITRDLLSTTEDIYCIHYASYPRQLFVLHNDGLSIYEVKYTDEDDDQETFL